jgi:hypothetical protein
VICKPCSQKKGHTNLRNEVEDPDSKSIYQCNSESLGLKNCLEVLENIVSKELPICVADTFQISKCDYESIQDRIELEQDIGYNERNRENIAKLGI